MKTKGILVSGAAAIVAVSALALGGVAIANSVSGDQGPRQYQSVRNQISDVCSLGNDRFRAYPDGAGAPFEIAGVPASHPASFDNACPPLT